MPRASGRRPPTDTSQTSRSNAPVQSRCCAVAPGGSPRVCASPRAPTTRSVRPGWRRRARGGLTIIGARRARIHTQVGIAGGPHDVDFSGDGRFLWVTAERANRLVLVSVPTGRVARSVATSGPPHDLAVDRRRGRLWVTIDGSSAVGVRSVSTGRLLHRPVLGAAPRRRLRRRLPQRLVQRLEFGQPHRRRRRFDACASARTRRAGAAPLRRWGGRIVSERQRWRVAPAR
jgi:hypothetical protein